jgi:ATP-dependent protease HslVU (ClpYQ) peptidase subunit
VTCIVGFMHNGKVIIGGDSAGVCKLDISIRNDPKVFINGPTIMGFTSSFRMGQLLHHKLKVPKQPKKMDDYKFMCTLFVDAVRKCLKAGGYAKEHNGEEEAGTFLVGYKGQLYKVDCDYQVAIQSAPYDSVGCGEQLALGALAALQEAGKTGLSPMHKVELALRAAQQYSAGVREPFIIKEL